MLGPGTIRIIFHYLGSAQPKNEIFSIKSAAGWYKQEVKEVHLLDAGRPVTGWYQLVCLHHHITGIFVDVTHKILAGRRLRLKRKPGYYITKLSPRNR